jgi:hypothetical protein
MSQILTQSQWRTRVNDTLSMIRLCHMDSVKAYEYGEKHIRTELRRVTGTASRRVYSAYVQGYVQALMDAGMDGFYRNDLEFCYLQDGVLFATGKNSEKRKTEEFYASDTGHLLSNLPSGHYWKGTDKAYYLSNK